MIKFDVTVDSDLLEELAFRLPTIFGEKAAPATKAAFEASARYVQGMWKGWAMGSPIKGVQDIKKPNSKLAASIKIKKHGVFDTEIYTESLYMQRIQEGTDTLDMKETHPYGRKSRVSKKGVPYLIVPFRWGTPNQEGKGRANFKNFIPVEAFKTIKKMNTSKRLDSTHPEKNFSGQDIQRSEYNWAKNDEDGIGRYDGEGDMNGMVRMSGGGGYFTFRVISAEGEGWIRRAVPGIDVVSALESEVKPIIEDIIQAGLEVDIGI